MDALFNPPWRSQPDSPVYDGDQVYSTHFMDNQKIFANMMFTTTWTYNDLLDADKLHSSLCRVLGTGDWRKLGGRLRRLKSKTLLELHVPAQFTPERPPVGFSSETLKGKLRDHPAGKAIPDLQNTVVRSLPLSLASLAYGPKTPQTVAELLAGDDPAISLRVVTFDDATVVTLMWPHILCDAAGLGSLVRAWSLALNDPEAEIPPLSGIQSDLLWDAADSTAAGSEQDSEVANTRLGGFAMLVFGLYFLWGVLLGPKLESRALYVSKEKSERLRSRALAEITKESANDQKPWISVQDALLAVCARSLARTYPSSKRPITVLIPFDARKRLPGVLNPEAFYVQNLVLDCFCTMPSDLISGPLGNLAMNIRETLLRQIDLPQALGNLRNKRRRFSKNEDTTGLSGPSNLRLLATTDWSKADLYKVGNFKAAVIRQGEADSNRSNPVGSPFFFHSALPVDGMATLVNTLVRMGDDHKGGVWYTTNLAPQTYQLIEDALAEI